MVVSSQKVYKKATIVFKDNLLSYISIFLDVTLFTLFLSMTK